MRHLVLHLKVCQKIVVSYIHTLYTKIKTKAVENAYTYKYHKGTNLFLK